MIGGVGQVGPLDYKINQVRTKALLLDKLCLLYFTCPRLCKGIVVSITRVTWTAKFVSAAVRHY